MDLGRTQSPAIPGSNAAVIWCSSPGIEKGKWRAVARRLPGKSSLAAVGEQPTSCAQHTLKDNGMTAIDTLRDALFGNPPSPTAEISREGVLDAFTELYDQSVIAVFAAAAGITIVPTIADRNTFYSDLGNREKLVYVNNNNGLADDPANGVYEYAGGSARLAVSFYAGVATVVQPLVNQAEDAMVGAVAAKVAAEGSAADAAQLFEDFGLTPDLLAALIANMSVRMPDSVDWWPEPLYFYQGPDHRWNLYRERSVIDALIPVDLTNPAVCIHVDRVAGNNTRTGIGASVGDFSNAVSNVATALQKGNALGVPFQVKCRGGQTWESAWNPSQSTTTNQPTVNYAITSDPDNPAIFSTHSAATWAVDGTYPNLYSATVTNALRVLDRSSVDQAGFWSDYQLFANAAALAASGPVNGCAIVGNIVYVRRIDGGVVTDANTRVLRNSNVLQNTTTPGVSIYLSGIEIHGGASACFRTTVGGNCNIITERCAFRYPGSWTLASPCEIHQGFNGLRVSVDDMGGATRNDVYNYHRTTAGSFLRVLALRPRTGGFVGASGSVSNNSWTLHEDVVGICMEPNFVGSTIGSTIANVNDSRMVLLGGDISAGSGESTASAVRISTGGSGTLCEAWINGTRITGGTGSPPYTLYAAAGGRINIRNLTGNHNPASPSGGQIRDWERM